MNGVYVIDFSIGHFGEGNGNPLHYSCLEKPRDGRAWWAAVSRVAQNRTWLKRLSSSSIGHFGHSNVWFARKKKTLIWKETCTHVHCSIIDNSQELETNCATIGWMDKEAVMHTHRHNGKFKTNGNINGKIKREGNLTICDTWVELEGIMLSEVSEKEKNKDSMISLTCEI